MPDTQTISTAMRPSTGRAPLLARLWQGGTVVALLLLIAIFGIARPDVFISVGNFRNILEQVAILTIVACAQTVVMTCGDFDLSVGSTVSLSGGLAAVLLASGAPIPVAILAALAIGTVVGAINGLLIAVLKMSAFIATLATMTAAGGLAFVITGGTTIHDFPESFAWIGQGRLFGIPTPVYIALAAVLITWVLLTYTTAGRRWYAIGGNEEVARLSGISVRMSRFLAFTVAGLGSAVAGVVLISRLGSASPSGGASYMILAIAAVFLGMTVVASGQANVGGTLVGVAILGVLANGLNIVGVDTYMQQVLTGVIIAAAVALSGLRKRRS